MEIGIVGKPNVGKSTFFKAITLAEAEIADFPFTTIKPNIGIGYVRVDCACRDLNLACNPGNSLCINKNRFIPIKVIDVAGLVPGAHEGKGLGNQFLDDLRQADALIHIVDISGRTNEKGEPSENYNPESDIKFLEDEINLWFFDILWKNWNKIQSRVKSEEGNFIKELVGQFSGLGISENQIKRAIKETGLEDNPNWSEEDIKNFAFGLMGISKPIIIAANKVDVDSKNNFEKLRDKYQMIPTCSEAELALRQAEKSELIEYLPGDSEFRILRELNERQDTALKFITKDILGKFGYTGVQQCINSVVFDVLKQIVVYPVENENKFSDSKGNVLPDAYLLPDGSKAPDLAYKVHTDIGEKFIGAIDCRTRKKIGKDYVLKNGDVIKILTSR